MTISPSLLACVTLVLVVACTPGSAHGGFFRGRGSKSFFTTFDALFDFQRNQNKTNGNVTVVSAFTGQGCSTRGVLRISLASAAVDPSRRRVLIDLYFRNPTNWTFTLGDSSANDGAGGEENTQTNDAEVQGTGTTLTGYLSDNGGSAQAFNIPNLYTSRLSLVIGDGHITWLPNDRNKNNYYSNPALFALNGQADSQGPVNYDLYLGVNQVPSSTSGRVGSGLCKVGIKFLSEV